MFVFQYKFLSIERPDKTLASRHKNICITFIKCWTNVEDVGLTLYNLTLYNLTLYNLSCVLYLKMLYNFFNNSKSKQLRYSTESKLNYLGRIFYVGFDFF